MSIYFYQDDLPQDLNFGQSVAIDTETMGLNLHRDRLCLVQLSGGDGDAHLVQIRPSADPAPRLQQLLADPDVEKLFHFARFDLAVLMRDIGPIAGPVFCTKIASKLTRTYTDRHGLADLCRELLGTEISKQQQSSDWGADELTEAQKQYAAGDVLYLHKLQAKLKDMLTRLERNDEASACFRFLTARASLDLMGFEQTDIFHH